MKIQDISCKRYVHGCNSGLHQYWNIKSQMQAFVMLMQLALRA